MSALAHQTSLTTPIEEFFSAVLKDDVSRAEKALKKGASWKVRTQKRGGPRCTWQLNTTAAMCWRC